MSQLDHPFIPADRQIAEITVKGVILSILLAMVLAMSNAYLALKAGLLISASIPAAVISMGILRLFRSSTILENNLVQTAASAGEAVAGGIVYTIPALIMIGYWQGFAYWENVFIAFAGGTLGVLFSIPMRYVLVNQTHLPFPEGRAIAEVLKTTSVDAKQIKYLLIGGGLGALIEFVQTGLKVIATGWQSWWITKRTLFGFGAGFSSAMVGAGYLMGFHIAFSIILGAFLGWFLAIPILSHFVPHTILQGDPNVVVMELWKLKLRYVGIGAMLCAGVWTFITLLRPFTSSFRTAYRAMTDRHFAETTILRTERDLPISIVIPGIFILAILIFLFFQRELPISQLGFSEHWSTLLLPLLVLYLFIMGFIFCAVTGYFSGLVGVTATPGSAIIISGILMFAMLLLLFMKQIEYSDVSNHIQAAEVITIMLGAFITGSAAIANDNIQDLKVGHLLGATPWKQQVMLIIGVCAAALVIPAVMQLLFNVYGVAGVMPHPGMNPAQSLPAPPAALLAAISQAVFNQNLPWDMFFIGIVLMVIIIAINAILIRRNRAGLSPAGIAIGMYLPLSTSIPIFVGGLIAKLCESRGNSKQQPRTLLACGLISGAALMDVLLAIPFSLLKSADALSIVGQRWEPFAAILGGLTLVGLWWVFQRAGVDRDGKR